MTIEMIYMINLHKSCVAELEFHLRFLDLHLDMLPTVQWNLAPSEKGSALKGKNLLPLEDPFQKGLSLQKSNHVVTKVVSLVKNDRTCIMSIKSL